jgi:hypothetical protein
VKVFGSATTARVMKPAMLLLAAVVCTAGLVAAQQQSAPAITDLTGAGWSITNGNGSMKLAATVPAYALQVLHESGRVNNPLDRCGLPVIGRIGREHCVRVRQHALPACAALCQSP